MIKGTTPTLILTFPEEIRFENTNLYVTISSKANRVIITKETNDLVVNDNVIELFLTQEETLQIPSRANIQVNWTYHENGVTKRACSNIVEITNNNNLLEEVLT